MQASSSSMAAGGVGVAHTRCFSDYHFSSFIAMEQLVTVLPRFTLDKVACLAGSFGPFAPNEPVRVPLWLALYLRQCGTCTLVAPPYVRLAYLHGVMAREQASESSFEALPFYFYETVKLLAEHGGGGGGDGDGDVVANMCEVVRVVDHIRALRRSKLQRSMSVLEADGAPMYIPGIKLTNIVCNELHYLRSSFAQVLEQACRMDMMRQRRTSSSGSQRDGESGSMAALAPPLPPPIRPPAVRLSQLMHTPSSSSSTTSSSLFASVAGSAAAAARANSHRGGATDTTPSLSQVTTTTTTTTTTPPEVRGVGERRTRQDDTLTAMRVDDGDVYALTPSTDTPSMLASHDDNDGSGRHTLTTMTTNTLTGMSDDDGGTYASSLAALSDDATAAAAAAPPAPKKRRTLRQV